VIEAGFNADSHERAKSLVTSFEQFIEENRDEITALQVLYSRPYSQRLRLKDIKVLAETIKAPPRSWTPDALWRAYETLDHEKVRSASGHKVLTNIVSLVRFATHQADELVPFPEQVNERFANWMMQQESAGRQFTAEQRHWLEAIRDHIASSLRIDMDDFGYVPFAQRGGVGKVYEVFGNELGELLDELNEALVA
jgi:type I restriction enzyme, R subunit